MSGLPPGFQFFPSDEELIVHFLFYKAALLPIQPDIIPVVDSHHCDPWELQGKALQGGGSWYFFCRRLPESHSTANGHWRSVGDDEVVMSGGIEVGIKKTMVFYAGEAAGGGVKTRWVLHQYHLLRRASTVAGRKASGSIDLKKWVICRVYEANCEKKDGDIYSEANELSCLDEIFLTLDDDFDEVISFPNY
ncbi:NAC transcription factor 29 [Apostasia shenzhenica]|uniref:NAC transcription factor 29 n=1 Tax=Apostasia shenzhenica TaxID=1088818 RepID=A0A2H9ZXB5_9ASPA|nr:NAC transcription factor 29 [Apostasia shenzhenica]